MTIDSDSAPSRDPGEAPPLVAERRRAAIAFAGWLVGASILTGVARTLQAGYALGHFGMEELVAAVLAISVLRVDSASVATAAAGVALVVATHGRSSALGAWRALPPWRVYAAVPLATPVAACVILATGLGTTSAIYHVPAASFRRRTLETANFSDLLVGLAYACAFAVTLGAIATFAGPRLAALRWGIARKIVVALLVTGLSTRVIRGVADAVLG